MEEGREGEGGGGRRWGGEGKWAAWQQRNVFNLSDPGLPAVYSILLYCKPINNTGQEELHGAEGETRNRYWPEVGIATLNRYLQYSICYKKKIIFSYVGKVFAKTRFLSFGHV